MFRRHCWRYQQARRELLSFNNCHGFQLCKSQRIDALNLVAYHFVHEATGAVYYHVDINDTNNTFCIGFRTPAENDKGTSHVLEHTTLCGSKRYPVRDPFFMMMRRSLSTFMNAMTGPDYTLYPFSTTNSQDFKNLLGVYLDAVFHPLLREEDFCQEGHRVELETGEDGTRRLLHNGVVYNEMRGVVSDPSHHFMSALLREMLPQTHYTYISGGYPPAILQLSYEELRSFHQRHYNPTNSITFTYGDEHPEAHMQALNEYFAQFGRTEKVAVPTLPDAARFKQPHAVQLEGPLDPMGHPSRQKRIAVSYAVPQAENKIEDVVELSVLDSLLGRGPSAPMFKALIEPQIGSKYAPMKGYAFSLSTPIISYGVAGVDEARADAEGEVLRAVTDALTEAEKDGFDERRVRSVVFQEELQQRHRAADYGLNLCTGLCAMGLCRADNDPLDFINWLPHLQKIAADNGKCLLSRIRRDMLDNTHRAVVSVSAREGHLNKLRDELKGLDQKLNEKVTEEDLLQVEERTKAWLERVRAPQQTDLLPTLKIDDIPKAAFAEPVPHQHSEHVATIGYPTNGLVYVHGITPFSADWAQSLASTELSSVPQHYPLTNALLGQTGAARYSYKDFSIASELVCGGFSYGSVLNESYTHKDLSIAGTTYGFYTTKEKLKEALELLATVLREPRTNAGDAEVHTRILSQTKMACSSVIQSLQSQGNRFAVTSAVSQFTRRGQIREHWQGLAYSKYASSLLEQLQGSAEVAQQTVQSLAAAYAGLAESLRANMSETLLWATCEEGDREEVARLMQDFVRQFPKGAASSPSAGRHIALCNVAAPASTAVVREALPIDTSFVGSAVPNGLRWTDKDQAALRVACTLVSNEFLHRRVREEGGAYGAGAAATLQGEVGGLTMSSYRDPTPDMTIQAFAEVGAWLADAANITQSRVDEAKLRLFSTIDSPYAADSFGEAYFLNDVRQELKQEMRNNLLAVTRDQIVGAAKYFEVAHKGATTVLEPVPEASK